MFTNILLWVWQLTSTSDLPGHQAVKTEVSSFEPGTSRLLLLSEFASAEAVKSLEDSSVKSAEVASQEKKTAEPAAPPALSIQTPLPWCGQSVIVASSAEAASFLEQWRQMKGSGELHAVQEPTTSTWWVHLPPYKDETEANKKLVELREKKIDSYYMRKGELAGGISLGVYSRKQSAIQVQADLLKKGYKTELKEVYRTESRTRLELRLEDRSRMDGRGVRELLAGFQQLGVQEIPCR